MRAFTPWLVWVPAAFLAAGCEKEHAQTAAPKPPVVIVNYPTVREVIDYEEVTGRTDARLTVDIRPHVTGYLIGAPFKDGAIVKKGTLLFEINPEQFKADLEKAEANLEQSKAKVTRLEADYHRATKSFERRAISAEEYDKVRGDLLEARASVSSYQASVKMAKINVEYTLIKAPFNGRVGRRLMDPGNLAKSDETLLTTIVSLDPMYAYFDVDERTWLRLLRLVREEKVKSLDDEAVEVKLALADEDNFPHTGKINFADNKLDAGTGTLRMRGIFANPGGNVLTPGMFVRLRINIGKPYEAVLIAERALGTDQGQKYLYVVNDKNEVEYRKVKTGAVHSGLRVIESGLASGERVIVNGLQRVRPGGKVDARRTDEVVAGANGRAGGAAKLVPAPKTLVAHGTAASGGRAGQGASKQHSR